VPTIVKNQVKVVVKSSRLCGQSGSLNHFEHHRKARQHESQLTGDEKYHPVLVDCVVGGKRKR
jgi:hypothetical protein